MKNNEFLSPGQIAWRRYKSNTAGMISLIFIILCALMAIFAYFIIPDNTPDANTQILEISTQKEIMPEYRTKNPITFERGCRIENGTLELTLRIVILIKLTY